MPPAVPALAREMMTSSPVWFFQTPRRLALKAGGKAIALVYLAVPGAGGWSIRVDGRDVSRHPDLVSAQGAALALLGGPDLAHAA